MLEISYHKGIRKTVDTHDFVNKVVASYKRKKISNLWNLIIIVYIWSIN